MLPFLCKMFFVRLDNEAVQRDCVGPGKRSAKESKNISTASIILITDLTFDLTIIVRFS